MNREFRRVSLLIAVVVVSATVPASPQMAQPANPGFEEGELGAVPSGWLVSWQWPAGTQFKPAATETAFARLVNHGCRTGTRCAMLTGSAAGSTQPAGNLMQSLPLEPSRRRFFRLAGWMRAEGAGTRVQMWMRFERADGSTAFLDNGDTKRVVSPYFLSQRIESTVGADVTRIVFGFVLFGGGIGWVDDVELESFAIPDEKPDEVHGYRTHEFGDSVLLESAFAKYRERRMVRSRSPSAAPEACYRRHAGRSDRRPERLRQIDSRWKGRASSQSSIYRSQRNPTPRWQYLRAAYWASLDMRQKYWCSATE